MLIGVAYTRVVNRDENLGGNYKRILLNGKGRFVFFVCVRRHVDVRVVELRHLHGVISKDRKIFDVGNIFENRVSLAS